MNPAKLHLKLTALACVYTDAMGKKGLFLLLLKNKEMVLRKVLDLNGFMEGFLDDVLKATVTLHKLRTGRAGKPRDEVCALEKTEILYSRTLSILSR